MPGQFDQGFQILELRRLKYFCLTILLSGVQREPWVVRVVALVPRGLEYVRELVLLELVLGVLVGYKS